MTHRNLKIELALIFGLLPAMVSLMKPHGWMAVILWTLSAAAWAMLSRGGYRWRREWNGAALTKPVIMVIVRRFIPFAIALFAFTWITIPNHLFSLPLERPQVWVMVMLLYPLLSAIPQEIIFRSFFLRRYATLMPNSSLKIANALAFGWVHIILQNWVAICFSVIGGWLFADTYQKTRSLAAVCFEHALYGCYIFTIGLGVYFYHGQAVH